MGKFDLSNAGFVAPSKFEDSEDFLLVGSFGFFGADIYVVPGIKDAVTAGDVSNLEPVKLDTKGLIWPNNV